MNSAKSPFIKKAVNCPVCNSPAENRFIIPKSYVEKAQESDHHVTGYHWLDEDFKDIQPHYYHFWHCPACKFTATQRDFTKPDAETGNNFSTLKRTFQKVQPAQKQIIMLLASEINYDQMNFSLAMKLHLLGIYIQELMPADVRDTSKLGSYYLRLAWLVREQQAKGDSDGQLAVFTAFAEKISKLWAEVTKTEPECLKRAAYFYEQAYQSHPRYSDIVLATDLMILISDIYLRAGDFQAAMKSLNNVMQTGQKFRAKQQEIVHREQEMGKLSLSRKAQLDAESNRINALMEKAGDMRQEIVKIRVAEQEPKARLVVDKLQAQGVDPEAIREKLKELNFEPTLILRLLGEPKRKKFLGLF